MQLLEHIKCFLRLFGELDLVSLVLGEHVNVSYQMSPGCSDSWYDLDLLHLILHNKGLGVPMALFRVELPAKE